MGKPKPSVTDQAKLVVTDQFIEIIYLVLKIFDNDIEKARFWIVTKNPSFGFIAPLQLIVTGRGDKVLDFVEQGRQIAIDEAEELIPSRKSCMSTIMSSTETRKELREWTLSSDGKGGSMIHYGATQTIDLGTFVKVREVLNNE